MELQSCTCKPRWWCLGTNDTLNSKDSPFAFGFSDRGWWNLTNPYGRSWEDIKWPSSHPTLTIDSNDPEPLTPSKLLLLRPNVCFPPGESDAVDIYWSKRWKQAQYLADIFWKRWILEYFPALQVKQKWLRPRPNLAVGDLVLVAGKKFSTWTLAKGNCAGSISWASWNCSTSHCQNGDFDLAAWYPQVMPLRRCLSIVSVKKDLTELWQEQSN